MWYFSNTFVTLFRMIRCPVLSAAILLITVATAHADSRAEECHAALSKISAEHRRESTELQRHFADRLADLTRDHLQNLAGDNEATAGFRSTVDRVVEQGGLDKVRAANFEHVLSYLSEVGDPESYHPDCAHIETIEAWAREARVKYERAFGGVIADVEERIEIDKLGDGEGLVVIAAYAFGYAETIKVNRLGSLFGGFTIGPLFNAQHFRVHRLQAGNYSWDEVTRSVPRGRVFHDFSEDELVFGVEAGKLNYTGVFVYDVRGDYAGAEIEDRAAIVLTILEQRYPELLENYEIANGLVPEDDFIDFYLTEKRALEVGGGPG